MVIHVRDGEPLFKVIKRFTKEVQRAGILTDLREHRHFVTAGQKRKRKRRRAERQRVREARERKET